MMIVITMSRSDEREKSIMNGAKGIENKIKRTV